MRFPRLLALSVLLAACTGQSPTSSSTTTTDDTPISLVPEFATSSASSVDPGGVGGAQFPDDLKLTIDQQTAIQALHKAFETANAADIAALKAIEQRARAARDAHKTPDEVRAIIAEGATIVARMSAAFAQLQAAIWQVYTPAQRAWIEAHRPKPCGPAGPPPLTDAQRQQIHALQEAFTNAVRADMTLIKQVNDSAHHAADAGATKQQVEQILHQADAARARVHAAELKLQQDLDAVLTPEQRAARCQPTTPQPPGR